MEIIHRGWGWWAHLFLTVLRRLDPLVDTYDDKLTEFCVDRLQLPTGAKILDVGCGAGDVALRLARQGYKVLGVDISAELIAYCQSLKEETKGELAFELTDMRQPFMENEFHGAICLGVTYGYFLDDENLAFLASMARALKPGGKLLVETDNPLDLAPGWVEETASIPGMGYLVMRRRFNVEEGAYEGEFHLKTLSGEKVVLTRDLHADWDERIRIYQAEELEKMASSVGLTVTGLWGDTSLPLQSYLPQSRRLVLEAVKN